MKEYKTPEFEEVKYEVNDCLDESDQIYEESVDVTFPGRN